MKNIIRTVSFTFTRKAIKRALKREDHLVVLISFDPRSQHFRYTRGAMSPVEAEEWHDDMGEELLEREE